jgi:hypothetical protein
MDRVLGPYPLCPRCRRTNGGLVAVRHRQIHLRAAGRQACVDRGLAGLIACLWEVCETTSCCEEAGDEAYVVPTEETGEAAVALLAGLRLSPRVEDGTVYFRPAYYLADRDEVRRRMARPPSTQWHWRVTAAGVFELYRPVEAYVPPDPETDEQFGEVGDDQDGRGTG